MIGLGRKAALAGMIAATAVPTASEANPLAVGAAVNLLGKVFGHHRTTGSAVQPQSLSSVGDSVTASKVEKVELERIRKEIARDRKARKWKPLKQVKYLPPNASVL